MKTTRKDTQLAAEIINDPRWAQIVDRNPQAGGKFFYAVTTTGVYCRPGCPSRLPRPEHVRFFDSTEEAGQAGFKPCRRCRPDRLSLPAQHTDRVAEACRFIEEAEAAPGLEELAARAGMSKYHFHRLFKQATGLTPRQYAQAHREQRVRQALAGGGTVTDAIYAAGYGSNSRFYEQAGDVLGMTPGSYRSGGANTQIVFAVGECSLGSILVARSDRGVCAILLGDEPDRLVRDLQDRFREAELVGGDRVFEQLVARVVGFIEAPRTGLDLPLDVRGTAFQQRVWQALRQIPAGETASYSEIARRIGAPRSVRAVAGACAANTLAVAIPCHRVVRTDGSLSGYRWGVERKRALLEREARQG